MQKPVRKYLGCQGCAPVLTLEGLQGTVRGVVVNPFVSPSQERDRVGCIVPDLPIPEHVVDPAMMEKEDGIERGGFVLAHVPVGKVDVVVVVVSRNLETADGGVDIVVWVLQGIDDLSGVFLVPLFCRARV